MRNIGLLLFLVVLIAFLSNVAVFADRNNGFPDLFKRFWPEKYVDTEEQKALETGVAPFAGAENAAQPEQIDPGIEYDPLGEHVNITETLNIPHRNEGTVSKWVSDTMPDIMAFSIDDYEAHRQDLAAVMNGHALQEFQNFMVNSKVLGLMQTNHYELKSFVTDVPRLRGSGDLNGRYRWVYDVPMNMTFLPVGTTNYKELTDEQFVSESVTFRIQLGRVAEGGQDGIIIETWEALKKKAEE